MTLPEVMIVVAISGIVMMLGSKILIDFFTQSRLREAKVQAVSERETASQFIKKSLTGFVPIVTGVGGKTAPAANFWVCSASSCVMTAPTGATPLRVDCASVSDERLRQSSINTIARDQQLGAKCLTCPAGRAPQVSVSMFRYDPTTGNPTTVISTKQFPNVVGALSNVGSLAMGVCVDVAPYRHKAGSPDSPWEEIRYDRWSISLITVYLEKPLRASMTPAEVSSSLAYRADKIFISPDRRFAPGFRFVPSP